MSFLGSALGAVVSTVGGLIGGSMQANSASKQAELEAKLQRENWEYAQKNAHQFEVEDLRAAGLNPILSANHSQLASMPAVSIPSGPSAYGNLGTNLASAIQASMHNEIEKGKLENEKRGLDIKEKELTLAEKRNASDIQLNEKKMDEMDNRIDLDIKRYKIEERLASYDVKVKESASYELYARAKKELEEADLTALESKKLDITLKYGSILAGYLPAELRSMILGNLVTWAKGHQDTVEHAVDELLEIATSRTSPSEKESDVKQVLFDLFNVNVTYNPSLLTDLIKVKRK